MGSDIGIVQNHGAALDAIAGYDSNGNTPHNLLRDLVS